MKQEFTGNRRSFMKLAALLGGAIAGLGPDRPAAVQAQPPSPEPEGPGRGYRLTEHIKKYYRTARL
jgi:hypothetical protein